MKYIIHILLCAACALPSFAGTYEEELGKLSKDLGESIEKAELKTVAVASFKDLQGKDTNLGKMLAEDFSVDLVNQRKGLSVVDRANLNRLLEEHKLTEEGLVDPENSKKLKLAGIDAIVFGTVVPFEKTYRISLKAITTDSARVVAATRGSIAETESLNSLAGLARTAVSSIPSQAPSQGSLPGAPPDQSKTRGVDMGQVTVVVKSVTFLKREAKVRVIYSVTAKINTEIAYELKKRDPTEEEGRNDWKRTSFDLAKYDAVGGATDDKGNTFGLLMPQEGKAILSLPKGSPTAFQIEYQMAVKEGEQIQIPTLLSFWFQFRQGNFDAHGNGGTRLKYSVVELPIDRVQ